jgi:hypothetical protein
MHITIAVLVIRRHDFAAPTREAFLDRVDQAGRAVGLGLVLSVHRAR